MSTKAVLALTAVIVFVCIVFLAVSINLGNDSQNNAQSVTGSQAGEVQRIESPASRQETEQKQSAPSSTAGSSSVSNNQSSSTSSNQNQTTIDDSKKTSPAEVSSVQQGSQASGSQDSRDESKDNQPNVSSVPSVPVQPEKPACPYDIPEAKNGATLVLVIDDAGQNINNLKRYTSLPFPMAVAVLPKLQNSSGCAYVVRSSGKELMLHQPMQSLNLSLSPGPGAITPDMTTTEIAALVKENLDEIGPRVSGLNNHEGSLITENEIKIGAVLEVCMERNIFFLDSRTTAQTKAPQAALERDMDIKQRDVFLDDVVQKEAMLEQLYRALSIANKNGKAIMIGHVDKSVNILPDLLLDIYPYLVEKGYVFATPSAVN